MKWPFTLPAPPLAAWFLGLFWLGILASLVGELTLALVYRVNRFHIRDLSGDMIRRHNQSINALEAKDKESFTGINKLANQAFGKVFFNQMAMGMAGLWPAFLAAAWLEAHFAGLEFFRLPWLDHPVGWLPQFVLAYLASRFAFGRVKRRIPFIDRALRLAEQAAPPEEMRPLEPPPSKKSM